MKIGLAFYNRLSGRAYPNSTTFEATNSDILRNGKSLVTEKSSDFLKGC